MNPVRLSFEKIFFSQLFLFFLPVFQLFAQHNAGLLNTSSLPAPQWHYQQEYIFDHPVDTNLWNKQEAGLHAAFGSTDALYMRCEVPAAGSLTTDIKSTGWRGERVNSQLLIWSPDTLK